MSVRTRAVVVSHIVDGVMQIMSVREIAALSRRAGARVLVDGALAFGQIPVDITALDCDYYATSLLMSAAPYAISFAQAEADWNALND